MTRDYFNVTVILRDTEKWTEESGLTVVKGHKLSSHEYYPELFVVSANYCS